MKDFKKVEDFRLPEVGSEKVKKCMQEAVERVVHDANDWTAHGAAAEVAEITVHRYKPIFNSLEDCDFNNGACINSTFKKIIDCVFDDITANEVLGILNDAYAIAIHAANTDFPEYEIRNYRNMAGNLSRSTHARDMVMAFGAFLFKDYAQGKNALDIHKSNFGNHIYLSLLSLDSLKVFFKVVPEYDSKEQEELDRLKKNLNPPPHPVEPFLDAIVRYAEALPPDQWSVIRAIGSMLHAKGAAGRYIPSKVYQEYEQRIDNLANCPKPEQGSTPLPAPHTMQKVQEEEPQKTTSAAHPSEPSVQGTSAPLAPTPTPQRAGKKGGRAKSLFTDLDVSREQAEVFLSFLQKENLISQLVDCKQDNDITAAFLCFCDHWKSAVKGFCFTAPAGARFLRDECGLNFDCGVDSYENILRREKNKPRKIHWKSKVEDFLSGHN